MNTSLHKKEIAVILFLLLIPVFTWANKPLPKYSTLFSITIPLDTTRQQTKPDQQEKGKAKDKKAEQPAPQKPDVVAVPKARKQSRPKVVKPVVVKVKPIKVIRPKIKKP